jgi:putative ABC transport system ATP-binding protein
MMNVLGCLDIPTHGEYYLDGTDVRELSDKELSHIRNKQIGFIFQQYNLIQNLNVLENVAASDLSGNHADDRREMAWRPWSGGLSSRIKHRPPRCPAASSSAWPLQGQFPPIRRLSWPTSPPRIGLPYGKEVLGFLQQLNKEGSTVILITHDNGIAATARRCVRMADGRSWKTGFRRWIGCEHPTADENGFKSILGNKAGPFLPCWYHHRYRLCDDDCVHHQRYEQAQSGTDGGHGHQPHFRFGLSYNGQNGFEELYITAIPLAPSWYRALRLRDTATPRWSTAPRAVLPWKKISRICSMETAPRIPMLRFRQACTMAAISMEYAIISKLLRRELSNIDIKIIIRSAFWEPVRPEISLITPIHRQGTAGERPSLYGGGRYAEKDPDSQWSMDKIIVFSVHGQPTAQSGYTDE